MTPIRILALAALLLLSACGTPRKPFEAGVRTPPPAAFERADSARAGRAPDPYWWRALNDPLLDALVARASRENRDLQAAEAELRRARAIARLQGWTLLPSGGVGGSAALTRAGAPPRNDELFALGADVGWEIDLFGRLRSGVRAANADAVAVDEARRGVLVALAAETSAAYAGLRGAQSRLSAARANAEAQAGTLRLTEGLRGAGRGTRLDVARAREQLLTTQAGIAALEAEIAAGVDSLEVLTAGLGPELRAQLEQSAALPPPPRDFGVGAPDALLRRRPDIRGAEARLIAATARTEAARVDWFPRLSLLGSLGFGAGDLGRLFDSDGTSFSIGPRIDWPALDYRRNQLRLEAARAGAEAEFLRFDQSVIVGVRAVETALANLDGAARQARELSGSVGAAREAADLSALRYREGLDPFFNVLDAQRRLAEADDRLAAARTRETLAYVRLGQALGVGWEAAETGPASRSGEAG